MNEVPREDTSVALNKLTRGMPPPAIVTCT